MADAPRQDWKLFESRAAASDAAWLRGLSIEDRWELHADMYNLVTSVQRDPETQERLDRWRWEQKLAARLRMVEAFTKLDELRRARAAVNHAC